MSAKLLFRLLLSLFLCIIAVHSHAQNNSGLQVSGLTAVDASAIGVLTTGNGGFPADMWQEIPPADAIAIVRSLPNRYNDKSLLQVARKLLLTAAPIDKGSETAGADTDYSHDFILARIEKLYDMGLYNDAYALLQLVPGDYFSLRMERFSINLLLQLGNYEQACIGLAPEGQLPNSDDNFWQKFSLLCAVLEQRFKEAEFITEVMEEVQGFSPSFITLVRQAIGIAPADNVTAGDGDIISAVLQDTIAPPSFSATEDYDLPQLQRLLRSPAVSDADKILIAYRLFAKGALQISQISSYYGLVPFYKSRTDASDYTEADYTHAFRLLADSGSDREKAAVTQRLLNAAVANGQLPTMLEQLSPYATIEVSQSLARYAHSLALTALYAGDVANAVAWGAIARDDQNGAILPFDVLWMLSHANAYVEGDASLPQIFDEEAIAAMSVETVFAAAAIMQRRGKVLLPSPVWLELSQRTAADSHIPYAQTLLAGYIASLFGNAPQAMALSQFIINGDAIAANNPLGYLQLWEAVGATYGELTLDGRRAILAYFLNNGFAVAYSR